MVDEHAVADLRPARHRPDDRGRAVVGSASAEVRDRDCRLDSAGHGDGLGPCRPQAGAVPRLDSPVDRLAVGHAGPCGGAADERHVVDVVHLAERCGGELHLGTHRRGAGRSNGGHRAGGERRGVVAGGACARRDLGPCGVEPPQTHERRAHGRRGADDGVDRVGLAGDNREEVRVGVRVARRDSRHRQCARPGVDRGSHPGERRVVPRPARGVRREGGVGESLGGDLGEVDVRRRGEHLAGVVDRRREALGGRDLHAR